jgi:hypothetical protein
MTKNVNRIRNADFVRGRSEPLTWKWSAKGGRANWERGVATELDGARGVTINLKGTNGAAHWSQVVVCKPQQCYRIEATVTADLESDAEAVDAAGVVIEVQALKNDRPVGRVYVTPGICRASSPTAIRTYLETPVEVRRVRVRVGVTQAQGTACIYHVRFIEMLDADEASNILALPAPPHTLPAPQVAKNVLICSSTANSRPITRLLSAYFGDGNVKTTDRLPAHAVDTDALILPDADAPRTIRSITGLKELAMDRVVVISLRAFADMSKGALKVRRVEQEDDPICAKVVFANHATRGFALNDTFSFAGPGKSPDSFVQNHFRKSEDQEQFFKNHGLITILNSVCDRDATCDRPICLYRPTPRGGLYVLDLDPVEAPGSTFGEPVLAMHLLLSILGQTQHGLGQYVVPDESESEFRGALREAALRHAPFVVHDSDLPTEEIKEQIVTIGGNDQSFGMTLSPKPTILVRSGLVAGDVESAYGAFIWFKQLVRSLPHACPYARQLAAHFRMAWVPWAAEWEPRTGWRRASRDAALDIENPEPDGRYALLVDVLSVPTNRVRARVDGHKKENQRYVDWLPRLFQTFQPGRYFLPAADVDQSFADRDARTWRRVNPEVEVVVDRNAFRSELHRSVLDEGGQVIRLEIPSSDADYTAYSIQRTDLVATLLEQTIGLQFGLLAVNRSATAVTFNGFSPVAPGEALIVDQRDPMLRVNTSQAG